MKIKRRVGRHRREWWTTKTCSRRALCSECDSLGRHSGRSDWVFFLSKSTQLQRYLDLRKAQWCRILNSTMMLQVWSSSRMEFRPTLGAMFALHWSEISDVGHLVSANWSPTSPDLHLAILPCTVQSEAKCTARSCHILQMTLTNPSGISV
jgi:hypothetical protein